MRSFLSAGNIDGSIDTDESHSGKDVALYAIGTVSGAIEQNLVFDIVMKAFG